MLAHIQIKNLYIHVTFGRRRTRLLHFPARVKKLFIVTRRPEIFDRLLTYFYANPRQNSMSAIEYAARDPIENDG